MEDVSKIKSGGFFQKLAPVDVIALVTIAGGLYLKFSGADGLVGTLLTAICFYYFGKQGRAPADSNA